MALSDIIKTQFDAGSIALADGTGTPLTATLRFDQADFSLSGVGPNLRNVNAYQSRATLHSLRQTDIAFPTGSFSCMLSEFSESGTGTFLDLILGQGAHSARVSTTSSIGDVMTFDLTFTMEGTDYGDSADHTIIMEDVHIVVDFSEGDPNTLTFNYTVYGDITGGEFVQAVA